MVVLISILTVLRNVHTENGVCVREGAGREKAVSRCVIDKSLERFYSFIVPNSVSTAQA